MFSKTRDFSLYVANFLLCNLCVGPLVVSYWQGTWRILDNFAYIGNKDIYFWVLFSIGFGVCFVTILTQRYWIEHIAGAKNWVFVPVSRCYTYISAFGLVHLWYGIWHLADLYSGKNLTSAITNIIIVIILLGSFRTLRNIAGAPNIVLMDLDKDHYFKVTTRFKTENAITLKFAADAFLTVILGGAMVALAWRGTWLILDLLLFPNNTNLTTLYSFIIYLSIEVFILIVHIPVKLLSNYLDDKEAVIIKILFEDLVVLMVFLSCVCCWRGMWLILDTYFITENKKLAAWAAHLIGFFGLTFFMFSQSVLLKGCTIDGELTEGEGVSYPTQVLHKMIKYCTHAEESKKYNVENDVQNGKISTITAVTESPRRDDIAKTSDDNQGVIKNYGSVTEARTSVNPSG